MTYQSPVSKLEVSANDFISNYVDRDYRYNEMYDSLQVRESVVPQLVMPQKEYYSAQSDRINSEATTKYRFNDASYGIEYEYRQAKTERVVANNSSAEEVVASLPQK